MIRHRSRILQVIWKYGTPPICADMQRLNVNKAVTRKDSLKHHNLIVLLIRSMPPTAKYRSTSRTLPDPSHPQSSRFPLLSLSQLLLQFLLQLCDPGNFTLPQVTRSHRVSKPGRCLLVAVGNKVKFLRFGDFRRGGIGESGSRSFC